MFVGKVTGARAFITEFCDEARAITSGALV